jgi:hypothetical protein
MKKLPAHQSYYLALAAQTTTLGVAEVANQDGVTIISRWLTSEPLFTATWKLAAITNVPDAAVTGAYISARREQKPRTCARLVPDRETTLNGTRSLS